MKTLEKLASFLAGLTLFVLVVITIGGVIMRYFFNSPWHWTEEMSGLLMVWIIFVGMAAAEYRETNLTISFITDVLKPKLSALINLLLCLASVALLLYMGWLGYKLAAATAFRVTQILKVSLYWMYIAVPVGAVLTALLMLPQIRRHIRTLTTHEGAQKS